MNTCTVDGCDRAHRARGLCASHYNQTHRKDQHREVPCAVCGTLVIKNGPGINRRSVCSERCRYAVTHGHDIAQHREIVGPVERRIVRRVAPAESPEPRTRFVAIRCEWCDRPTLHDLTTTSTIAKYCSRHCARKVAKVRRRAREHGALGSYTWSEVIRLYLTLGGCAYCRQPTTDVQPDHVVPLSRGGSNSITNVVPCCRSCNTDKRTLLPGEWIEDRIRRGLRPLSLDPRVTHLTDALLAA